MKYHLMGRVSSSMKYRLMGSIINALATVALVIFTHIQDLPTWLFLTTLLLLNILFSIIWYILGTLTSVYTTGYSYYVNDETGEYNFVEVTNAYLFGELPPADQEGFTISPDRLLYKWHVVNRRVVDVKEVMFEDIPTLHREHIKQMIDNNVKMD